jgi:DNA processing protein
MDNDIKYWNAVNQNLKIGPARFKKLYSYFEKMEQAWQASHQELKRAGLEEKVIEYFLIKRKEISPDLEMEKLRKEGIGIITIKDKKYPKLLKEIYNPPALLYIRGKFTKADELAVGVVGTRKPADYGKQITPDIVKELSQNKITVVSGLALGIDSLAHLSALSEKGRTVAVLGSGLDKQSIYPYANRKLAEQIEENGAVIAEYPCGTLPLKQHFPARNRIISGLSLGTLIVEAPENSGALITARYALEQNRDVFAVPGNIYNRNSAGPNNLIKMGAKLVSSAQDILDELNLNLATSFTQTKEIVPDSKEEEILLKFLSKEPIHIDKLVHQSKLDTATVGSTLTLMEMKGKVRNLGGTNYVIGH